MKFWKNFPQPDSSPIKCLIWPGFFHHSHQDDICQHNNIHAFGEFVSAYQSNQLRGCMGWWNHSLEKVNSEEVQTHFQESLHDALFFDPRSQKFRTTDFYTDPTSELHFQVMVLPVGQVRQNFSNVRQGILWMSSTHRATFLPNVFHDAPLSKIIPLLLQKAGIEYHPHQTTTINKNHLYSYKTKGLRWKVTQTYFHAKEYLTSLCDTIASEIRNLVLFYLKTKPLSLPYFLPSGSDEWLVDDVQYVRNLSCLELLREYYGKIPKSNQYRQHLWKDSKSNLSPHDLVYLHPQAVQFENLDDEFGKPQYLLYKMKKERDVLVDLTHKIPWEVIKNSIFGWNWWTQVIVVHSLNQSQKDWSIFKRLESIMKTFTPRETNEWAVLFEGSAVLFTLYSSLQVQSTWVRCLQELGQRRRSSTIFYMFQNGDCRFDITCHVLNGLFYLSKKNTIVK